MGIDQLEAAGRLVAVTDGEWAGWYYWAPGDPFEDHSGPFYCREDAQGRVCGFRPGLHNRNGGGAVHGGALMTFADYALFMIAASDGELLHGVTVTMNAEFVRGAAVGDLLTARGEVVRAGRSLLFVRGTICDGEEAVLAFSGTIKRMR